VVQGSAFVLVVDVTVKNTDLKYVFMSCHQNAGQNHNINTASKFFEPVVLGMTVTNQMIFTMKLEAD
jgi:hypothetical protein